MTLRTSTSRSLRLLLVCCAGLLAAPGCSAEAPEDAAPALSPTENTGDVEGALAEGESDFVDPAGALAAAPAACTITVDPARELVIRALSVVEDPVRTTWTGGTTNARDGAWTFGRLMTQMAGPNDPQTFVRNWLAKWETPRTVNGFTVPARTQIKSQVIDPWPKAANGKLDLTKAPMRLLAITNRMDLRNLKAGNAGEGRFVFGVTDALGNPLQFTVILEYKLPATTAADVDEWARLWHALGSQTIGTAAYNSALQAVTDRFARRDAAPTRPNGSSIGQVRTNEIALSGPWELREFRLGANGQLGQATVSQTPDASFNGTATFAEYVNTNTASILAGKHVVPLKFNGASFRGGSAPVSGAIWSGPGITSDQARHLVSVNTCNGCHGFGETNTPFLHVRPRAKGQVAGLSAFLTGEDVTVNGVTRHFDDIARRRADLVRLLCSAQP
ncbi:MAG: hypothetical protein JST00_37420 [Deltaproteobacteria bacterium]|nr:hypothetical protein [Deltaproteobacteria bacterium]